MKLSNDDVHLLQSLDPYQILQYLSAHGWQEEERVERKFVVLTRPANTNSSSSHEGEFEILVPLQRELRDFSIRITEVLETLEVAEQRSYNAILQDLETASMDVLRFRIDSPQTQRGKIPLEKGLTLAENVKKLVTASSSSVLECKPFFPKIERQVKTYLSDLEMGHSRGSYILYLLSPVYSSQLSLLNETEAFSRQSLKRLLNSTSLALSLAEEFQAGSSPDIFLEHIQQGISANLCDSVVGIAKSAEICDVEISIHWASVLDQPVNIPEHIVVKPRHIKPLEKAAQYLKAYNYKGFELRGLVIKLSRPAGAESGSVTVLGVVDSKERNVRVDLTGELYDLATEAHKERAIVFCKGDLTGSKQ